MVGTYGNSWIRTPQLDRLACESFVLDQALICSPELDAIYRDFWSAPADRAQSGFVGADLLTELAGRGIRTVLMTDDPDIAAHPLSASFREVIAIRPRAATRLARSIKQTQSAQTIAQAAEFLHSADSPYLLWLHLRGLAGPWDAPFELRAQYAGEEDPEPSKSVEVPNLHLGENYDPDEVLDASHRYAGQISALDTSLGEFLDELRSVEQTQDALFTLLSARGFPLGEHRRIGPFDNALYSELVQIPWLIRQPKAAGALGRSPALVQSSDLRGLLLEWWGFDAQHVHQGALSLLRLISDGGVWPRERVYIRHGDRERGLRTPAWYARWQAGVPDSLELYAKPGDRWEVNQVANRCTDVAAAVEAELVELEQNADVNSRPPLDELLLTEAE